MSRVYNFGPGPSTLPEPVLNKAREDLPEWHSSGMSVIELSHRGKDFVGISAGTGAGLAKGTGWNISY